MKLNSRTRRKNPLNSVCAKHGTRYLRVTRFEHDGGAVMDGSVILWRVILECEVCGAAGIHTMTIRLEGEYGRSSIHF